MSYKIVIPVYLGGEIVENLIKSLDVHLSNLILVDNTPNSICKKFEGMGISIFYYPENIGVARAWNLGLKAGADWTFILSQASVFPNGFSSLLLDINPDADWYMTAEGWHCVAISKKVVERIGYFDTNFYPAYFEDADYSRRANLAEMDMRYVDPKVAVVSVGSSSGLGGKINFAALSDYFTEKWGAGPNSNPEELYTQPFEDKPLNYFPERSVKELQNRYAV